MAVKRGLAAIALLPSGSVSGHFIDAATRRCYGLYGTEIPCERECSRAEDSRLVNLRVMDFKEKREFEAIVEFRGGDAARFRNAVDVHGWEEHAIEAQKKQGKDNQLQVAFECFTLKSGPAAEAHIRKYMAALANLDAVVNIGRMIIRGLDCTPGTPVKKENERKRPAEEEESKPVKEEKEPAKVESKLVMDSGHSDDLMANLLKEELLAAEAQDETIVVSPPNLNTLVAKRTRLRAVSAGDTAMKDPRSARQIQNEPVNTEPDADEED